MSNIASFRKAQHPRCISPPGAAPAPDFDPDMVAMLSGWHATIIEQIHGSVRLLDLTAERARSMSMQISDQQARQNLIGQIESIERLLQIARDMMRRL